MARTVPRAVKRNLNETTACSRPVLPLSARDSLGILWRLDRTRYNGIVEVVGSIPTGSTNQDKGLAGRLAKPFFSYGGPAEDLVAIGGPGRRKPCQGIIA